MRKVKFFIPLLAVFLLVQCKTVKPLSAADQNSATITRQGWIDCFEKGLSVGGVPVWCEASAVLYDGKNIFFANDKDMPDSRSSVFYRSFKYDLADSTTPYEYLRNPVLKYGKKFEDFALTPDGQTVLLSTAFDRVKPGAKDWNGYNTIYYWQAGNESNPKVLNGGSGDSSSIFLRHKISKALATKEFPDGMPYFKVEGLAATASQLFLGIREEGKKFDDFKYAVKIITVSYHINDGVISLEDNFKILAAININNVPPFFKQPMGISSIEYDHFNNRFLILTSYEGNDRNGGYLWTASLSDLENNKMTLVRNSSGNPVSFSTKTEDIAIINKRKAIIICDDDRLLTMVNGQVRQPNQAAYMVVEFK